MERVLDLGCGPGDSWRKLGLREENWRVVGLDLKMEQLQRAKQDYGARGWNYLRARGEQIPLSDASLDGVVCNVALPYMHIPRTLAEIHRVLIPGGWLKASLHLPGFTWGELRRSFPRPKNTVFRFCVLCNGMILHCSGRVISVKKVSESCQTERGMRIALRRAGFHAIHFRREGPRFFVEALRDDVDHRRLLHAIAPEVVSGIEPAMLRNERSTSVTEFSSWW